MRLESRESSCSVSSGGDMRSWHWRRFIVDVLIGASAIALAVAAVGAKLGPILVAFALLGIALLVELDVAAQSTPGIGPEPPRPPLQPEPARPEPRAMAGFDAAIVDPTSV